MKIHTCAKQIPVRSMLGGGGAGQSPLFFVLRLSVKII